MVGETSSQRSAAYPRAGACSMRAGACSMRAGACSMRAAEMRAHARMQARGTHAGERHACRQDEVHARRPVRGLLGVVGILGAVEHILVARARRQHRVDHWAGDARGGRVNNEVLVRRRRVVVCKVLARRLDHRLAWVGARVRSGSGSGSGSGRLGARFGTAGWWRHAREGCERRRGLACAGAWWRTR